MRISSIKAYLISGLSVMLTMISCSRDPNDPGLEYMPNMYRSPSYETYTENPNFEDGMTARMPVKGTIPRGFTPFNYPNTPEGYETAGSEFKNPLAVTDINIAEGKRLYMHFCTHCHGENGAADGKIVANGKFPPPPAYDSEQLKNLPEGKMYFSIVYGKNLMGPHASLLNPEERWKVIMFIQTLQKPKQDSATANADSTQAI